MLLDLVMFRIQLNCVANVLKRNKPKNHAKDVRDDLSFVKVNFLYS